jgi:polysaccharide biosynthesis transport protein
VERDNVFSLQDYLAVLRRQRGLIALTAVFAAVAGAVWFLLQTPMYEARAELALERVRAAQDVSLNELLNPSGNVRDTDVAGATSPSVAQSAAELLGRDDPSQLRTQVRAESVSEDRILRITATDADPVTAAQIADAFATAFIEYRRQEAVDTVLLTQGELDQRASEIREEISAVDAQIAALGIPPPETEEGDGTEDEAAEGEAGEGAAAEGEAGAETQAAEDGDAAADEQQDTESAGPAPTTEELDELETLQIRRNALRTQLSQVIARSTELGESADALTGFAADFTPASVPTTPIGNTIVEVVGVAFILGLALGIGLAFVRDHFDDVIRDEDDFKRASEGRPVLGRIPIWKPRDHDTERVASLVDPTSSAAEAYRELSAGVRFLLVARADEPEYDAAEHHGLTRSRVVMICSANIGEGKTETAANLAVAAARVGLRTVLVDADLRRPAIAKRFGLGRSTGLSDALLNGEPAERHMVDVGVEDLYVLPAGTIPPNPAELLASPAMRAMQQGLLRKYDLVVIDTPAVLAVPDALEIGPYVDLAVMVGRVGQTGRRRLGAAVERLEQVGSAVSGTVLNGLDRATDGYYYAYAYEEPQEKKSRRQTRRERKAAEAKAKADAKAEAKQAKVDAKQARVDAKAEAKAAKRDGRRQGGRGGDRRGYDEQVEQTLRAAGGAAAVNEVVRRAAAESRRGACILHRNGGRGRGRGAAISRAGGRAGCCDRGDRTSTRARTGDRADAQGRSDAGGRARARTGTPGRSAGGPT